MENKSRLSRFGDKLEKVIVSTGFLVMLLVTFVNVLSRYLFNMSISFMETLTINLFVWVALFGSAIAAKQGAHLGLTIITDISPVLNKISIILTAVLSTVFYSIIGFFGLDIMKAQLMQGQMSATLNIPEWILMISVPLGCLIIIIRFVEFSYNEWKKG